MVDEKQPKFEQSLKQIEKRERATRKRLLVFTLVPLAMAIVFIVTLIFVAYRQAKEARMLEAWTKQLMFREARAEELVKRYRHITARLIEPRVVKVVADIAKVDPKQITRNTDWDSLGASEFDVVALGTKLQEEFNVTIPEERVLKLKGVEETVDAVVNAYIYKTH